MTRTLALSVLFAVLNCSATAQTTLHYREGQRVEPLDVKRILDNVGGVAGPTRSIRMLQGAPAAPNVPTALSLPVRFDFDSSSITPSARRQLDALAQGIKLLPAVRRVVIEGHSDASGPDDYNQALSLRRAAAVKVYLVQTHGIDAQRLQDTGVGKRQPIADTDPYAGENRRVQFHGG